MLVLSRFVGESLLFTIGDVTFTATIQRVAGKRVRLLFDVPDEVRILRSELLERGRPEPRSDETLTGAEELL